MELPWMERCSKVSAVIAAALGLVSCGDYQDAPCEGDMKIVTSSETSETKLDLDKGYVQVLMKGDGSYMEFTHDGTGVDNQATRVAIPERSEEPVRTEITTEDGIKITLVFDDDKVNLNSCVQ